MGGGGWMGGGEEGVLDHHGWSLQAPAKYNGRFVFPSFLTASHVSYKNSRIKFLL